MNERITKLRNMSIGARVRLDIERALLITEFYRDHCNYSEPVNIRRAKAFSYILRNKHIEVFGDELIVGERGSAPSAVPTYPEINLHSLDDLEMLNTREKVPYHVSSEFREIHTRVIFPFWKGRNQRERIMHAMDPAWKKAYNAGIFTEFQEQRTPGHTVAGEAAFQKGIGDSLKLGRNGESANPVLLSFEIAARAMVDFAGRYASHLEALAKSESRPWRRSEFQEQAEICRKVPKNRPETFHEALQHYWFLHLGVIIESNPWDSFNPGRLDRHLYPFYRKEIQEGTLTRDRAKELLQSFWIKFNNHPAPPKVGVTARESSTYTDFSLINLGGLTTKGEDSVNDLTYLILEVIGEMRLLQPSSMIQVSKKNPDRFIQRVLEIIKTGYGQPSMFNSDIIIKELVRQGKSLEDAMNGGASGCVESGAFGTEAYFLTGYFNFTKILELSLYNGIDPVTGEQTGLKTGDSAEWKRYEDLLNAFRAQMHYFLDIKMEGNRAIEKLFSEHVPVPFLSLLIEDCIPNRRDYNSGGPRYNTSYIQGVGLGSVTDSMASLKYHVFDRKNYSMRYLLNCLESDFKNDPDLRFSLIYNTPKYGNDDPRADERASEVFEIFFGHVDGKPAGRPGAVFRINLLPTTSHIYFGSVTGAMPDGRKKGKPLSEGISPVQGSDRLGPTAVLNSALKIDHERTGGTLLNQRFSPSFFDTASSIDKLVSLIRSYFNRGGHHIQFNVVHSHVLKHAQEYPEEHQDLIVRVAGYSDYFNNLGRDLQDEIIRRTEHV